MVRYFWPGWQTTGRIGQDADGEIYEIQRQVGGRVERAGLKVILIPRDQGVIEQLRKDGHNDESIVRILENQASGMAAELTRGRKPDENAGGDYGDVRFLRNENGIGGALLIKMELTDSAAEAATCAGKSDRAKKKKNLTVWTVIVVAVVLVAFLAAVGLKFGSQISAFFADPQSPAADIADNDGQIAEQETITIEESTEASEAATIAYWHPLTGEVLEEPFTDRIIAFNIDNVSAAMPQHGVAQADVICEMIVEGSATRTIALFSQTSCVNAIGPLRGARPQLVSFAKAFDAVFVHLGGSDHVRSLYNTGTIDYIDNAPAAIYKDSGRLNQGYASEHAYFASGEKTWSYAKDNFDMTFSAKHFWDFDFDAQTVNEPEIAELTVRFGQPGAKTTFFQYNKSLGGYTAEQFGNAYIDGDSGSPLVFQNVMVLLASPNTTGEQVIVGENNGWYVSNGQIIPIVWSRKDELSEFSFSNADGTPLTVIPGKSYIAILPNDGEIEYNQT